MKYCSIHSISSFHFSQLGLAGYYMAKLYYRGWLVGQLVSWSVGRGRSVGQSVSQSEDRCFIDLWVWYFSNAFKQRQ